ncbi:TRAP transporter small permease [Amorphus sp. MBR-141]
MPVPAAESERGVDGRPLAAGGRAIGSALETLLGLVLIAVVLINVANAAGRYLFRTSLTGTDEVMVFSMVFVVVIGAVLALARRTHIAIDLLPTYAHPRFRRVIFIIHDAVTLATATYAGLASWSYVSRLTKIGTTSMTLGVPMTIPHGILLFGFGAMAVISFVYLLRDGFLLLTGADAPGKAERVR